AFATSWFGSKRGQSDPSLTQFLFGDPGYEPMGASLWLAFDDCEAQRVADLMVGFHEGDPIPADLSGWLGLGATRPEFQTKLVALVPPDDLMGVLDQFDLGQTQRESESEYGGPDGDDLGVYQGEYSKVLDGLGVAYSGAARVLDGQARIDYLAQWTGLFGQNGPANHHPALAALVIARGDWPNDFLTGFHDAITAAEGAGGAASWADISQQVIDPGRLMPDGSPVVVGDPMYGVWCAAVHNPTWMAAMYHQYGSSMTITWTDETGDHSAQVSPAVYDLVTGRGFDDASWVAFMMAAFASDNYGYLAGPDKTRARSSIIGDVDNINSYVDAQQAAAQAAYEAQPWINKHGHLLFAGLEMGLGLAVAWVPGPGWVVGGLLIGDAAVTGLDMGMYIGEGDVKDAVLTGLFFVPIAVGGVVKYVGMTADQLAAWEKLGKPGWSPKYNNAKLPSTANNMTTVGYKVEKVVNSGDPTLWDNNAFLRGDIIDKLLRNNVGHNFSVFDHFDFATGEAISVKSMDTSAKTYQSASAIKSRLRSYVKAFGTFKGDTTADGKYIDPLDVKSRVLEVAIPDRPLTPAQIAAFDEAKAEAAKSYVTIVFTVVK
ncbi:MAG: hypothetical protein FWF36_06770, partial [Propionibacteriaceae bacterium]|nr:hypothetical protein [Propionibacteriaceae bacterium]